MLNAFFGIFLSFIALSSAEVFKCNAEEYEKFIKDYELTLIQYSAEWCHFSQELKPIFEQVSTNLSEYTNNKTVILLRVDCDENANLCATNGIRKYPTIKMTRFGRLIKREYRGARTLDALVAFVHANLKDDITMVDAKHQPMQKALESLKIDHASIVGLFPNVEEGNAHLAHFKKSAVLERENCRFYLVHNLNESGDRLAFYEIPNTRPREITLLRSADFAAINKWISVRCTPLVRELTFHNAEEITDEGKPLLILFYGKGADSIKARFRELVKNELAAERATVNFLFADGFQFTHPLMHLRKTVNDLPVLCIDSLVHMFPYPKSVEQALSDPNELRQFVADLHSGKLHREFHYGPDPTPAMVATQKTKEAPDPPQSVFRQLTPSRRRYTILHDEF